jgi:hypothetical protein
MGELIRQKLNRVYGKGFYDGMKATQANQKEQPMNETRFSAIYKGLGEKTKKVYQVVPISESWSLGQMMVELNRSSPGHNHNQRSVGFCLGSLKDVGLIKEVPGDKWIRVPVRAKVAMNEEVECSDTTAKEEAMPNETPQPAKAAKEESTPLEKIGELSSQVINIIQSLHKLAADIDAAAIEVEEQIEKIKRDSIRLKKLQEIFKDLQE